jgi:hypothetical protein
MTENKEFVEIYLKDVPYYLKNSKLYEHLYKNQNSDDNETINISIHYYKSDLTINSYKDFMILMYTFKYWMINEIPYIIYEFIDDNKKLFYDKIDMLLEKFKGYKFVYEIEIIIKYANIPDRAVQFGLFDLLKYCSKKMVGGVRKYEFTYGTLNICAIKGNIEILKFLCEEEDFNLKNEVNVLTRNYSIQSGNLECVKYIHLNIGIPLDNDACNISALIGNLDILKYIIEYNKELCSNETIKNCIMKDSIDCLSYLVDEIKYDISELCIKDCFEEIAIVGSLKCLEYFMKKGYVVHEHIIEKLKENNHRDCYRYISDYEESDEEYAKIYPLNN